MHIQKQITVIIWSFIGLIVGLIVLALVVGRYVQTMTTADGWVKHTTAVKMQIDDAREAFADAETGGRLAIVEVQARNELEKKRQIAFDRLESLKNLVSDNARQSGNIQNLSALVRDRFNVQDRQIAAVKSDGNGKVISETSLSIESIETQERTVSAFEIMKSEENALFVQRYEWLSATQWRIIYLIHILGVLTFISGVTAFYFTYKTLKRGESAANVLKDKIEHNTNGKVIHVPVEEVQSLVAFIEQSGLENA